MKIFIDSHVHIYPHYDIALMRGAFAARTKAHGADLGVMMVAQRSGAAAPHPPGDGIVYGRQIACAERIEILALGTGAPFEDGIPARDAIRLAQDAGALPVLAWGVGKWMFAREKTVENLLASFKPAELLIGDSSLRPVFWPEPRLMKQARESGFRVIHGSDPLPPKSEQTRAGQYGDLADDSGFDPSAPVVPQILRILRESPIRTVGRRAGPLQFARRMSGK